MHPCTPPSNGHAFNIYWWYRYRIVYVQWTLNYTNLTAAPKCKKTNLNLCMRAGVVVLVLFKSPFCVKHPPPFFFIARDFDDLLVSTKTRHAPYNVCKVQSIHLQAALWMGMSLSQIKKIASLWEWPPPSPRNNWGPRCVLFPLPLCVGKFLFSPEQDKFFFFFPCGSSFFFPSMCGSSIFFFYFYLRVGQVFFFFFFFFLQKLPAPLPWSLMVRP